MRKSLTALTAATTIAVATVATPTTADAQWRRGGWWGPALGGFALGALFGSAFVRITATGTAPITWLAGVLQLWLSAVRLWRSALLRLLRRTLLTGRADKREP